MSRFLTLSVVNEQVRCIAHARVWCALIGSPFMVNVGGQPSGRSRETITRQIQSAELVSVGQKCNLKLKIPGRSVL